MGTPLLKAVAEAALEPKDGSPVRHPGYWVSVVTEDWRFRHGDSPKGIYTGVSLNAEGRKIADAWDPANDEATGEQCRATGLRTSCGCPDAFTSLQDEQTLKIETDAAKQTVCYISIAIRGRGEIGRVFRKRHGTDPVGPRYRSSRFSEGCHDQPQAGILAKEGVPYSASAVLTEYFDRVIEPTARRNLAITSTVRIQCIWRSRSSRHSHYKKQTDSSGWNPTPCSAR